MENFDCSTVARGRLAVLSAHLSASTDHHGAISTEILEFSGCSAAVAPPPNLKGSLILIDERTGKRYQVQVSEEGTIKATDFKKVLSRLNILLLFQSEIFCTSVIFYIGSESLPCFFIFDEVFKYVNLWDAFRFNLFLFRLFVENCESYIIYLD